MKLFLIIILIFTFCSIIIYYGINNRYNLICDGNIVLSNVSNLHLTDAGHYFFRNNGNVGSYTAEIKSVCIIHKINQK